MSKKVIYMLALAILMLATAGVGLWVGLSTDNAKADSSSQTQTDIPWIGVNLSNINSKLADKLGLTQDKGVVIISVVSGSPAEQAGLQAKDILLKIGTTDIDTVKTAKNTVSACKVGDTVVLTILRGTDNKTFSMTLVAAPSVTEILKGNMPVQGWSGLGMFGLNWSKILKELNLDGIEQGQWFDHYLGAQIQLTDKNNQPVTVQTIPGKVALVTESTKVLKLNKNAGGSEEFIIPTDAIIRKGNLAVELSALKVDDKVVIITITSNSQTQVKAVLAGQEVTIWSGMCGNGLKQGLMPQLNVPQMNGKFGNMLDNMMENWQKHLERFQNSIQDNSSVSTMD